MYCFTEKYSYLNARQCRFLSYKNRFGFLQGFQNLVARTRCDTYMVKRDLAGKSTYRKMVGSIDLKTVHKSN
jgi:hypothetical protein